MARSDTTLRIAAIAAKVQTIGQARAVLGETARVIREGYERVGDVSNFGSSFSEGGGMRDSLTRRLDIANAYAQGIYQIYSGATPDLFDQEISIQNNARVGWALASAREILVDIEEAAQVELWNFADILEQALAQVGKWIGSGINTILKPGVSFFAALIKQIWPWLIVAAAVLLLFVFRRRLARKVSEVAS